MEYSTPSSPNIRGSSRAKPTPNTTSRGPGLAHGLQEDERGFIDCRQRHQAQIHPEGLDGELRVIDALIGRTENTDQCLGE